MSFDRPVLEIFVIHFNSLLWRIKRFVYKNSNSFQVISSKECSQHHAEMVKSSTMLPVSGVRVKTVDTSAVEYERILWR